eukprot:TRINITY_DN34105_c0_g1_i1.p1 TRINITY_DN34105_c0_g1~~TRINITY_DN34105_c0_g1_i1.p1  ORF type:complete len:425 (-),score=40.70 TRINITY_DN34105_c0_g1_i1:250-1491(-)
MSFFSQYVIIRMHRVHDQLILGCSLVSALCCFGLLLHLLRLPREARKRLFWGQLATLSALDLAQAILIFSVNVAAHRSGISLDAAYRPVAMVVCKSFIYGRYILEFASCLVEVQIAAGFYAACYHKRGLANVLRRLRLLTMLASVAMLVAAVLLGMRPRIGRYTKSAECWDDSSHIWGAFVTLTLAATLSLYFWSVVHVASSAPGPVMRQALGRAFMYVANFVLTFSLRAATNLLPNVPSLLDEISWVLVSLNGTANALTYVVQSSRVLNSGRGGALPPAVGFSHDVEEHSIVADQRERYVEATISILDLQGLDTSNVRVAIDRHFELKDRHPRAWGHSRQLSLGSTATSRTSVSEASSIATPMTSIGGSSALAIAMLPPSSSSSRSLAAMESSATTIDTGIRVHLQGQVVVY